MQINYAVANDRKHDKLAQDVRNQIDNHELNKRKVHPDKIKPMMEKTTSKLSAAEMQTFVNFLWECPLFKNLRVQKIGGPLIAVEIIRSLRFHPIKGRKFVY